MRNALIVAGIVVLLVAGYVGWTQYGGKLMQRSAPTSRPVEPATVTYATSTFSISYPNNFTVDDSYAYTQFEGKPIAGVKFEIPLSVTEGANLSPDSGVSVEWLPRAVRCTGDIYVPADVRAMNLTVGSSTYSVATTTGAAAGNMYEETVYAIEGSKPCTAVRYFIHSSNVANYDPGTVEEFDRTKLLSEFDKIRDSLILAH